MRWSVNGFGLEFDEPTHRLHTIQALRAGQAPYETPVRAFKLAT